MSILGPIIYHALYRKELLKNPSPKVISRLKKYIYWALEHKMYTEILTCCEYVHTFSAKDCHTPLQSLYLCQKRSL